MRQTLTMAFAHEQIAWIRSDREGFLVQAKEFRIHKSRINKLLRWILQKICKEPVEKTRFSTGSQPGYRTILCNIRASSLSDLGDRSETV